MEIVQPEEDEATQVLILLQDSQPGLEMTCTRRPRRAKRKATASDDFLYYGDQDSFAEVCSHLTMQVLVLVPLQSRAAHTWKHTLGLADLQTADLLGAWQASAQQHMSDNASVQLRLPGSSDHLLQGPFYGITDTSSRQQEGMGSQLPFQEYLLPA